MAEHRDWWFHTVMKGLTMDDESARQCPRCGRPVIYHGRGRRPIWCSTRCRNEAAVVRRGAREAAVEIRMIDVPKQPRRGGRSQSEDNPRDGVGEGKAQLSDVRPGPSKVRSTETKTPAGAADRRAPTAAVLADPDAVLTVVRALSGLQEMGRLGGNRWASVRSEILSLADLIRSGK